MRTRVWITAGVALALASCGIGAVSQDDLTAEAQGRGGGVTTSLVDEAIAAVADEVGRDPLLVRSITATLAQVTIVVDGGDAWTYGTSGLYGGRGLSGPEPSGSGGAAFPVSPGAIAVDAGGATARDAVGPGTWVESVTVTRPGEGAAIAQAVRVTDGVTPATVVVDATGAIVVEGAR
jgi:hypothetical protein